MKVSSHTAMFRKDGVALLFTGALVIASSAVAQDDRSTSLREAQEAASRDAQTPDGKAWERDHFDWLVSALGPIVEHCGQDAPEGKGRDFTVYVRLSSAGAVGEAIVHPQNPHTLCFRDSVRATPFPDVPRDGYWFRIAFHAAPPSLVGKEASVVRGAAKAKATGLVLDYDEPPTLLKIRRPTYPKRAFKKKIEGTVTVELMIDSRGRVARARVVKSVPELDAAALKCVQAWIFKPATKGGQPVATIAHAPVTFRIH